MAGPIAGPPEPPRPLARDRGGGAPAARQAFWLVPSSDSKPESGPGSVAGAETRMKTSRPRHAATELGLGLGHPTALRREEPALRPSRRRSLREGGGPGVHVTVDWPTASLRQIIMAWR